MIKFSRLKRGEINNQKNKKAKKITLWIIGITTFLTALFGLCMNNYSQNVVKVNLSNQSSQSQKVNLIEFTDSQLKKWSINPTNSIFLLSLNNQINKCNDKKYLEILINHHLTNDNYAFIRYHLFRLQKYYNDMNRSATAQFLTVNNNNQETELKNIVENTTVEITTLINNLNEQKNALGGTGIVIGVLICLLSFLGLNLAIIVPTIIVGLTGLCCASSSNAIGGLIYDGYTTNRNIYFHSTLPPTTNQETIQYINDLLPMFQNLKNKLESNQGIIGVSQMLGYINNDISQLKNILASINKS